MGDDITSIFGRLFRYIDYDSIRDAILLANSISNRQFISDRCSIGYQPYKNNLHSITHNCKQHNQHIRSQLNGRRNRNAAISC